MEKLMNESESTAYDWLIKKKPGLKISFSRDKSPDFITSDGDAYEVKKAYLDKKQRTHIILSKKNQFDRILDEYPEAKLLIVNGREIRELKIKDVEFSEIIIHKPTMEKMSITIRKSQKEWVDKNHINLSKLMQDYIDEKMKTVKIV